MPQERPAPRGFEGDPQRSRLELGRGHVAPALRELEPERHAVELRRLLVITYRLRDEVGPGHHCGVRVPNTSHLRSSVLSTLWWIRPGRRGKVIAWHPLPCCDRPHAARVGGPAMRG